MSKPSTTAYHNVMVEKEVNIEILRENIIKLKQASSVACKQKNNKKCEISNKKREKNAKIDEKTKIKSKSNSKLPKFCAVVKANAYGHGYKQVCKGISDLVDFFAVANAVEALQVRDLKLRKPILILGKFNCADLPQLIKKGIRLTCDTLADVAEISEVATKLNKRAYVHIKINTGMNRLGVKTALQLQRLLREIDKCKLIKIEGIYTHFSTAESKNSYKLKRQNAKFLSALDLCRERKLIVHASNSVAFLKSNKYNYDMVRVGLAMYGYDNSHKMDVKPCLSVRAKIVKTQTLQKGESVGYGASFVATCDMQIAVVAIGYADGYVRAYEKGHVLICGQKCPIVGHICMDMLMCDITNLKIKKTFTCSSVFDSVVDTICDSMRIPRTNNDEMLMYSFKSMIDKVFPHNYNLYKTLDDVSGLDPARPLFATILGTDGAEQISARDLAHLSNTIEYEALTTFNLLRL